MPLPDGLRRSFDAIGSLLSIINKRPQGAIPSYYAAELICAPFPRRSAGNAERSQESFRAGAPGYAARQTMQIEKTMKPLTRYSPLIHPLVSHPSASHFSAWHPMAILVLAAWALQLARFAFVIVRWRVGNVATEAPRASGSVLDARM
jgi:hypothetical protein